ncbi:MAG: hypothetical protein IJ099_07405 [Alphaproteobacteria bacterium]|nr:hypothetical protein [Alphaproteobacteria bacterium]
MKNDIKIFEQSKIRSVYDEEKDVWYFSVIDVLMILLEKDYQTSRKYWNKLAERLRKEGAEQPVTNCHQLKMLAADGKLRDTTAADAETMLRIVQSVPSPKAEPIKQWLAKVGYERMKETINPAISIDRARENWQSEILKICYF